MILLPCVVNQVHKWDQRLADGLTNKCMTGEQLSFG